MAELPPKLHTYVSDLVLANWEVQGLERQGEHPFVHLKRTTSSMVEELDIMHKDPIRDHKSLTRKLPHYQIEYHNSRSANPVTLFSDEAFDDGSKLDLLAALSYQD